MYFALSLFVCFPLCRSRLVCHLFFCYHTSDPVFPLSRCRSVSCSALLFLCVRRCHMLFAHPFVVFFCCTFLYLSPSPSPHTLSVSLSLVSVNKLKRDDHKWKRCIDGFVYRFEFKWEWKISTWWWRWRFCCWQWQRQRLLFLFIGLCALCLVKIVFLSIYLRRDMYILYAHNKRARHTGGKHIHSATKMPQSKINKMPNLYLNKLKRWL